MAFASIASALDGPTTSTNPAWASVFAAAVIVAACVGVYLFVL